MLEEKKKPLDQLEIKVYRGKARTILFIELALLTMLLILEFNYIALCISVSILALAVSLIIGKARNCIAIV